MARVLIMEDKKESRDLLVRMVEEIDAGAKVYAVDNEDAAYVVAMKRTIDVFLVDIILHPEKTGDQSGAVFAKNIRNIEKYLFTPIIFITSLYDTKMCMFSEMQCYGFIEKPFDLDKTKKLIAGAMHYHTEDRRDKTYIFHAQGLLGSVLVDDIIYIESQNHKLYIYTIRDEIVLPYKTCRKMLEEIDSEGFEMCNRGTIVNMKYIERIDSANRYVYLRHSEKVLEIGSVLKKSFIEKYKNWGV